MDKKAFCFDYYFYEYIVIKTNDRLLVLLLHAFNSAYRAKVGWLAVNGESLKN